MELFSKNETIRYPTIESFKFIQDNTTTVKLDNDMNLTKDNHTCVLYTDSQENKFYSVDINGVLKFKIQGRYWIDLATSFNNENNELLMNGEHWLKHTNNITSEIVNHCKCVMFNNISQNMLNSTLLNVNIGDTIQHIVKSTHNCCIISSNTSPDKSTLLRIRYMGSLN